MAENNDEVVSKLLWVDLEMTGLEPETDRILEVAAIVTDFEFKELARYEAIIHQPEDVIQRMNEWAKLTHTQSGLVDKVATGQQEQDVIEQFVAFIQRHFTEKPILAGNSIHQDRRFIRKWWPQVEALLHYRMLDVSSYKIMWLGRGNVAYPKKETHRALDDIEESIAELKYYLSDKNS
jgi:oligoribonuclease